MCLVDGKRYDLTFLKYDHLLLLLPFIIIEFQLICILFYCQLVTFAVNGYTKTTYRKGSS